VAITTGSGRVTVVISGSGGATDREAGPEVVWQPANQTESRVARNSGRAYDTGRILLTNGFDTSQLSGKPDLVPKPRGTDLPPDASCRHIPPAMNWLQILGRHESGRWRTAVLLI
jgi:hypothetical protein